MVYCAQVGCSKLAYVEPRTGIAHKYCGRTHAIEKEGNVQPPHGPCMGCNLRGCGNTVYFDAASGRVHDFCCKAHARKAIKTGQWPQSLRDSHSNGKVIVTCSLPGCFLPRCAKADGISKYDYCGRSHAITHKEQLHYRSGGMTFSSSSSFSPSSLSLIHI